MELQTFIFLNSFNSKCNNQPFIVVDCQKWNSELIFLVMNEDNDISRSYICMFNLEKRSTGAN